MYRSADLRKRNRQVCGPYSSRPIGRLVRPYSRPCRSGAKIRALERENREIKRVGWLKGAIVGVATSPSAVGCWRPNETASVFVSDPQDVCSVKGVGLGQVQPITSGPGTEG